MAAEKIPPPPWPQKVLRSIFSQMASVSMGFMPISRADKSLATPMPPEAPTP